MTHRHIETGHLINGEVSNLKSLVITVDISTLKDSCRSVYKSRFTVQALIISHFFRLQQLRVVYRTIDVTNIYTYT